MHTNTGTFDSIHNCRLFYKYWLPEGNPQAVIVLLHGVGEYIERYKNLFNQLVPQGYVLAAYDQRGHGQSGGRRGHIDAWQDYRDDLNTFLGLVRSSFPAAPLFIYGHSMGSLVVLDYLMRTQPQEIRGAILTGTALEPADAAPPAQVFLAKTISGIYPQFTLSTPIPGSSLCKDPEEAKAYDTDPLVYPQRSARWGAETLKTVSWINAHPDRINLPVLFIHGEDDPLLRASGAQRFFDQITYPDKTIYIYPDTLHEPHNDLCFEQVIADIERWITRH